MLPAAAQLEMAREAAARAMEPQPGEHRVRLENVVFISPVIADDQPLQLHIALDAEGDGVASYEIYTISGEEITIHSEGVAIMEEVMPAPAVALPLVLNDEQAIPETAFQEIFARMGLEYGPAFLSLRQLRSGIDERGKKIAVGDLELPPFLEAGALDYILHPCLLDGALQAGLGLSWGQEFTDAGKALLPVAVEKVHVYGALPRRAIAIVRHSADGASDSDIHRLDVTIAGEDGQVVAHLEGYGSQLTEAPSKPQRTVLLAPVWETQGDETLADGWQEHLVLMCETPNALTDAVKKALPNADCITLKSSESTLATRYGEYAQQLLHQIQDMLRKQPEGRLRLQLAVPDDAHGMLLCGLSGMLKSAQKDNPRLETQFLLLASDQPVTDMAEQIRRQASAAAQEIRWSQGEWQQAGFEEVRPPEEGGGVSWEDGDVILITGGAGGLGRVFAQELLRQVRDVTLILAGRSALADVQQEQLKSLAAAGATIVYEQTDLSDPEAVQSLITGILSVYGRLDCVIHAAGVLHDRPVAQMTPDELRDVFAPKVDGLINLDEATKDIELRHIVLFSSAIARFGNAAQAGYAAANGFMDGFALYRNMLAEQGKRYGHTLALNWPLWADGGMQMPDAFAEQFRILTGVSELPAAEGVTALEQALKLKASQLVVLHGDAEKIRRNLCGAGADMPQSSYDAASTVPADNGELASRIEAVLIALVAEQMKIRSDDIDTEVSLDEFGFDSISLTAFTNALNRRYSLELTPAILFEHSTLAGLAKYLATNQSGQLQQHFSIAAPKPVEVIPMEAPVSSRPKVRRRKKRDRTFQPLTGQEKVVAREPVAIIGMSGCFPMAPDLDALWANLETGHDCIGEIPDDRWNWSTLLGDVAASRSGVNVKRAGVIDGIGEFDPEFFGISPREAVSMDPQQRLLMMHVWNAIEDAGYAASSLSGSKTALLIGTGNSGYSGLLERAGQAVEGFSSTGAVPSIGPNRMSFLLNLHGPSEPVETACSSALVAIHRAISLLQARECDLAIAGGINTLLSPDVHLSFVKAGMLSPDGRCKTFSDQANGYVRGEGAGILVLKPLSAAERDGDSIYGLILGSAENHGGKANSLTAPNPRAQAELIVSAIKQAGVDPAAISYIETHGTGTALGDPVEIQGLLSAFQALAGGRKLLSGSCGLGSIKTNIGHLELAAGVAGVIKVLLQMRHKTLAPSLHCETLNPYIELEGSPFYVVREKQDWRAPTDERGHTLPRRAGVSSFGFGGVNAHVVLEEYIPGDAAVARKAQADGPFLIVLSAKNSERLTDRARHLLQAIEARGLGQDDLADIAYTLQVGRDGMEARLSCTVNTMDELRDKLARYLKNEPLIEDLYRGEVSRNKDALAVFSADEELQDALGKWIAKGKLHKLAELWVKGLTFDWNRLYGERKPCR
ncbi:MAG: SDR family NAD(P)-dependent oxidoreductase, partial [Alphaproteobacteria bacterium]